MNPLLNQNRVILCHYDTYSSALLFARFEQSVLAPSPLPEEARGCAAPDTVNGDYDPESTLSAVAEQFGLDTKQMNLMDKFNQWCDGPNGAIRIHLARFNTFEAPHASLEAVGAVFKPISDLRSCPMIELNFLRQAFTLFIG